MANIQSNLNKIKNAVLGVEVRDSIHDGIKAMNEEVEKTTGKQKQLEGTFDELIINAGSSNAEVVAARVDATGKSHDTLGKRLNNFDSQINDKANQSDLAVERARIDAFTKLAEGSTTGDAELIDGRVGDDGVTYNNLGDSIRTQFNTVKRHIYDLFDEVGKEIISFTDWENGSRSTEDGSTNSNKYRYRTSTAKDVSGYTDLNVDVNSAGGYRIAIYKYDSSDNYIGWISVTANTTITVSGFSKIHISVINDTNETDKVEATSKYRQEFSIYTLATFKEEMESMGNDIDSLKTSLLSDVSSWEFGAFWNGANANNDSTKRIRSEYIYVEAGTIIKAISEDVLVFAECYDINTKAYLSRLAWASSITVPSDCYVRIALKKNDNDATDITDINDLTNNACIVSGVTRSILKKSVDDKISLIDSKVANLEKVINNGTGTILPSYYDTQMESVCNDIQEHINSVGRYGETFVFCTDLHWENNSGYSPAIINEIKENVNVDTVILGGDYITQHKDDKSTAVNLLKSCMNAYDFDKYVLFGNHDKNSNETNVADYLTDAEAFNILQRKLPKDIVYGDYYYFYFDRSATKTRYICLSTGATSIDNSITGDGNGACYISDVQKQWCTEVMNSAPDGYHFIIILHGCFVVNTWNKPLTDGQLVGDLGTSSKALFSQLDTFNQSNSNKKVEAIITGHVHCDANLQTTGGIPIIFTDTDSKYAYGEYTATNGTVSEHCIDTITVDYTNKKIYCDRIGRGQSRIISY